MVSTLGLAPRMMNSAVQGWRRLSPGYAVLQDFTVVGMAPLVVELVIAGKGWLRCVSEGLIAQRVRLTRHATLPSGVMVPPALNWPHITIFTSPLGPVRKALSVHCRLRRRWSALRLVESHDHFNRG
ncbi:hypothetical protein KCP73_15725 [Salmonella enterica subsp. enterica]|nr:hypothetical protein KCP73_15725 [Salmonella enterica subsp. enterica]